MAQPNYIDAVRKWVESVVIDLQLCPFAAKAYFRQGVRFIYSNAQSEEELLLHLYDELRLIAKDSSIETTLLIHPHVLSNFEDYNQFLTAADELLEEMALTGQFQIASFHPDYQFADTAYDDVENFTNRSPYPVLHILNEEDISKAIDTHPDIHTVPERNQQYLRELGPGKMKALLKACFT